MVMYIIPNFWEKIWLKTNNNNKPRVHVDGQFGVRENPNNARTGTRYFIGTKLIVQPNDTDLKTIVANI